LFTPVVETETVAQRAGSEQTGVLEEFTQLAAFEM
jgi:hypothetical protein